MPAAWSCLEDDPNRTEEAVAGDVDSSKSLAVSLEDDATTESSNSQRSGRNRALTLPSLRSRLLKRPRMNRQSVPSITPSLLFNRLQQSSLVVVDCRSESDFSAGHIRGALHCPHGRRTRHKTVQDVLQTLPKNDQHTNECAKKLANRDMMEIVVIGSNRTGSRLLNRMDGGYRFAKLLLKEGRVFSVVFLTAGFPTFAQRYPFMLQPRASESIDTTPSPASSTRSLHETDREEPVAKPSAPLQYPNEILDGFLYLGNFWHANDEKVVADLGLTHIVNMGAITDDRNKFEHVKYLDIDIKDKEHVDIRNEFEQTVAFIEKASRDPGARVLVHCVQGVSRSSTIVIWYIMLTTKCTLSAAYSYVLKRRPLIFPNRGFMEQLMANEKELYGYESVDQGEIDLLQHGLLAPMDRKGSLLSMSL